MKQTLPRDRILRGRGAFTDILTNGIPISAGSVKLFVQPLSSSGNTKIGFAVSRGARNAVMRNRIKRCLREGVRQHQDHLPDRPLGLVFLYVGKIPARTPQIDCRKIMEDVSVALKRLQEKKL